MKGKGEISEITMTGPVTFCKLRALFLHEYVCAWCFIIYCSQHRFHITGGCKELPTGVFTSQHPEHNAAGYFARKSFL
jgi:hypothetical protein